MNKVVWTQFGLVFHGHLQEKAMTTPTAIFGALAWATVFKHCTVSVFILSVQVLD